MSSDGILSSLNSSQHAAVSSFADSLAILAGPGSGKTHTLTSRTAWLLHQGLQPWNIIVATFTVKAAREMKERIGKLIGNGLESKLILGTFHSIARRYLVRYGHLIDVKKDFGVADSSDSLAIIKRIVKRHNLTIEPAVARSRISSRKAKGNYKIDVNNGPRITKSIEVQEIETCYNEYEATLERSNLLDYDDLLLRCVQLLRGHPACVSNVEAVLIDEFQDTNLVQFDLMRLLAAQRKRITIVGDPDQSIYGFRSAETENFKRLIVQYPETVTIALEENYRSSGAILLAALTVIEQDAYRIAKSLMPTHTVGTRPVLRKLSHAYMEAEWIVTEIQRCLGLTGDMMSLNDFAILLRSASLSRLIESALGKAGIAYRMVGGLRFYDRAEVKTILDYLRVINQPDNSDALARIINVPSRRIGETTIKSLLEEAEMSSMTLWSFILNIVQGKRNTKTKLVRQAEQSLSTIVRIILTARNKIADSSDSQISNVELIDFVLKQTSFEDYLEKQWPENHQSRWANIQELRTQAADFQRLVSDGHEDETLPEVDGLHQEDASNALSKFLANVALASEVKSQDSDGPPTAQVTISTIHAAKGLEWPAVFIPAVYQGSIPHSRAEDSSEERRLLYVAMTRAKSLLYLSYPLKNSQGEETKLSPFLAQTSLAPLLDRKGPSLRSSTVQSISQILGRHLPSSDSISRSSAELQSVEDDRFSIEGCATGDADEESTVNGKSTFAMGQRAPKRQRIEAASIAGLSDFNVKSNSKVTHTTTMDQVSNSSTYITMKAGFVSASSHLQAFRDQSINPTIGLSNNLTCGVKLGVDDQEPRKSKVSAKRTTKQPESQGSLLSFLGKSEHRTLKPQVASTKGPKVVSGFGGSNNSKLNSHTCVSLGHINQGKPRIPLDTTSSTDEVNAIPPLLATRRLGPSQKSTRPQLSIHDEDQKRNEYVFLSSSPPRPIHPVLKAESPDKPASVNPPSGLIDKPTRYSHIRPATTFHTTTLSVVQGSNVVKKTLGVKRSMNGWSSQKGLSFKPPSFTKPI